MIYATRSLRSPPHSEPHYILFPPVRDHYSVQTFSPTPSQVSVRDVSPHQAIITHPEVAGEEVKKKRNRNKRIS